MGYRAVAQLVTNSRSGDQLGGALTYDERGRLIAVARDGSVIADYLYDANGNRTSLETPSGQTLASHDDQDRLLAYGSFNYTYTANGELLSKTNTSTGETTDYVYDGLGALRSVQLPDGTMIDYVIDGEGRRVGKKLDGALVQGFLYKDQLRIAAELDDAGALVAQFAYAGAGHSPEYMLRGGTMYRFVKDQLGSPRLIVDASTGDIAQELEYDEFGNVLVDTNPGFQPFGFAGGLYDSATGLVRFGARDYDAFAGRWTARDPLWFRGGVNLYSYANNDPVNLADRTGAACELGGEELQAIWSVDPIDAASAAVIGDYAIDYSNRLGNDTYERDSLRHCIWSCGMTRFIDEETAKTVGDIHEDCNPNYAPDREVDEHNNAVGRRYGSEGGSCVEKCSEGLECGELRTDHDG